MLIFSGSCDVSGHRLHQIFYRTNFYKTIDIVWYKTAFLVSLDIFERSVRDPENVKTEWHPSLRQHPTKINWYIFLFLYRFLGKTWRPRIKGRVFFLQASFEYVYGRREREIRSYIRTLQGTFSRRWLCIMFIARHNQWPCLYYGI